MEGIYSLRDAVPGCATFPNTLITVLVPSGQLVGGFRGQYVEVSLPIQNAWPAALMGARWIGEAERAAIREIGPLGAGAGAAAARKGRAAKMKEGKKIIFCFGIRENLVFLRF